jgi:hypothetical protein
MAWMADLKEPDTTARNRKGGSKEFSYIYCAIVRDGAIEVDFAAKKEKSINAAEDTLRDLKDEKNNHLSFACGKRTLQILYDTKIAYACLVSKAVRMESAFKLLEELKSEFVARTGSSSSSSKKRKGLSKKQRKQFLPFMKNLLQSYNTNYKQDSLAQANGMLNNVKKSVVSNIGKALKRVDDLEHVARRTDDVAKEMKGFNYEGRQLRDEMWWNRVKTSGTMFILSAGFILSLLMWICGGFYMPICMG